MTTSLIGMTLGQLQDVCSLCELPRFSAKQIARWLYVKRAVSIDQFTDISINGRKRLADNGFVSGREEPKQQVVSTDGTEKYLFRGVGNRDIECVMIPDRDRATLCVSSESGCRMNCSFCMTGR